jgi:hypothetical protein
MDGDTIAAHLQNLELSPEGFLREFNRFKALFAE